VLLADSKPRPLAGAQIFVPARDTLQRRDFLATAAALAQIIAALATTALVINNLK
jgi:hypothetical protein